MRRAALIAVAAGALLAAPAAHAEAPWRASEELRAGLFQAQRAMLLDGGRGARTDVSRARDSAEPLARRFSRAAPAAFAELRRALAAAERAAASVDEVGLAAARGRALAAVRAGAFTLAVAAAEQGRARRAHDWLLVREFRQATRFTRPGVDATQALDRLATGEIGPGEAATAVRKDLLDAYQARLASYLDEAAQARRRGFAASLAENAAIAAGYWRVLAPVNESQPSGRERARRRIRSRPRTGPRDPRRVHRRPVHRGGAGAAR
jgi:high-affinity iron transporter